MPGCQIVGTMRPRVWKDDDGWVCDQTTRCLKCGGIDFTRLAEDATFTQAIEASAKGWPTTIEEDS